jgi:uncharacterized protein (TIGR00369 family)
VVRSRQHLLQKNRRTIVSYKPLMDAQAVTRYVRTVFPQSTGYGWEATRVSPGRIEVAMKISDADLRPGGTISGPTMFTLADVAAYLLVLAHIGEVALAVTTNLTINFLQKPTPGPLRAEGRLLKLGKRLAVCEIHIFADGSDSLVAQATATYSIPPETVAGAQQ